MSSGEPVNVSERRDELRRQLAALAAYPLTSASREALREMQAAATAIVARRPCISTIRGSRLRIRPI